MEYTIVVVVVVEVCLEWNGDLSIEFVKERKRRNSQLCTEKLDKRMMLMWEKMFSRQPPQFALAIAGVLLLVLELIGWTIVEILLGFVLLRLVLSLK